MLRRLKALGSCVTVNLLMPNSAAWAVSQPMPAVTDHLLRIGLASPRQDGTDPVHHRHQRRLRVAWPARELAMSFPA